MLTASITRLDSTRPRVVRLRLGAEAFDQLGHRVVLDRHNMTIRAADLDEKHHMTINRKTRATSFRVPDEAVIQHVIGDYLLRDRDTHFQMVRDDYQEEDI